MVFNVKNCARILLFHLIIFPDPFKGVLVRGVCVHACGLCFLWFVFFFNKHLPTAVWIWSAGREGFQFAMSVWCHLGHGQMG